MNTSTLKIRLLSSLATVLLTALPFLIVQAADPVNLWITNVHLIDRHGIAEDVIVNIHISDSKLRVVTRDDFVAKTEEDVVDAQEGFLMGSLDVGQPAAFIILDKDPRKNREVLLDTKAHSRFAILDGVIVSNKLPKVAAAPSGTDRTPEQSKWRAYTAPPLAIPLDYHDTTKWNRFEGKYISGLFTGALIVDRNTWLQQDEANLMQVGPLDDFEGGEVRALRFGAVGTLNFAKPWIYTVFAATTAFDKGFDTTEDDSFIWYDYRLDIPFIGGSTLSIGKQKEPISMERLMSLTFLPWQERSAPADALFPSRNHGIVFSGTALNQRTSWAAGIFNNWIDSDLPINENPTQFVGRLTWLPFVSSDESNLLHLCFGLRRARDNGTASDNDGVRY